MSKHNGTEKWVACGALPKSFNSKKWQSTGTYLIKYYRKQKLSELWNLDLSSPSSKASSFSFGCFIKSHWDEETDINWAHITSLNYQKGPPESSNETGKNEISDLSQSILDELLLAGIHKAFKWKTKANLGTKPLILP